MDTALLQCFVTMARLGHLGKTAAELRVAKPTVSYRLKELEATVHQVLFERSARGLRLTGDGNRLLPLAQVALDAMDRVLAPDRHRHGSLSGCIDLGTIGDPVWLRSPLVLGLLRRQHPGLTVRLHLGQSGQVPRDVLEGRLTGGWVLGPIADPGLMVRTLSQIRLRVVGPSAWARRLTIASVGDLADFPWIDLPERCAFTLHRRLLFARSARQPVSCLQADGEPVLAALAAEGQALSLLREELALQGQQAGSLALWPGTVPNLHLHFILPLFRQHEPIGKALEETVLRSWTSGRSRDTEGNRQRG